MRHRLLPILATLLLGGCAAPAPPVTPSGSAGPQPEPVDPGLAGVRFSCSGHPFGLALLDEPGTAELEDHPSAEALRQFLAQPNAEADILPASGWHLAGRDAERASYVAAGPGDPPFVEAQLEIHPAGWKVAGWGQCRPQIALDGLGAATFQFAGRPPGPDTERFDVLVTEMACAGGRPPGVRLLPPQIAKTTDAIFVLFTVRSQAGDLNCPSNPSTQVAIELGEAVGSRRVLDAAVFPFHDPAEPWPPG
jgi:hypothetical protein